MLPGIVSSRNRIRLTLLWSVIFALGIYFAWHSWADDREDQTDKLIRLLELEPGMTVAEIGAGDGAMTVRMAQYLGLEGNVLTTEIDSEKLSRIRQAASDAKLTNVEVVEAGENQTNLPTSCCDAVFMRNVYHHFTDPAAINKSLYETVRPGGQLAVVDFAPGRSLGSEPKGVPSDRGGHGMPPDLLAQELTAAGFEQTLRIDDWSGRNYCLIFRKPAPVAEPDR